jgi:hypothetical protein
MSVPFLEFLATGDAPRGPTIEPLASSPLVRDFSVRSALAVRRALLDGALQGLDPSISSYVMLIDTSREGCTDTATQKAWQTAVRNISDRTAAYLSAAELEGIWNKITSSPCYRAAAAEQKTWVDLFAAIARRNTSDIVKLGNSLLGSPAPVTDEDQAYLTTITATAYIQMDQIAQAHSLLLQEQSKKLNGSETYWFPLENLLALTQPGRQGRPAPGGQ